MATTRRPQMGLFNVETDIFLESILPCISSVFQIRHYRAEPFPIPVCRDRIDQRYAHYQLKRFVSNCDVLFFEWANSALLEVLRLNLTIRPPIVVRAHRYEIFEWVHRIDWSFVDRVILDTEAMRAKLLSRSNCAPERAVVIPNAVPVHRAGLNSRPLRGTGVIGAMVNLIPRKRVYELILAFAALRKVRPGLTLRIAGGRHPLHEDYAEAILHLCDRLGIGDSVVFDGRIDDRWSWYDQVDIYVSYSYSEGMQVAPIEAASRGCYCLSHEWEGAGEIFSDEQLFITEADFVVRALAYLDASADSRIEMRRPLFQFVSLKCSSETVGRAIVSEIVTVAESHKRHELRGG